MGQLFRAANVARQPFSVGLAESPAGGVAAKELVASIDLDNDAVQGNAGEALFESNGEYSPYLRHKMKLLAELVDGEQRTRQFTARLTELELIHPIQLELKVSGQPSRKITGLYSIDEPKLRALDLADHCGTQQPAAICMRCTPCCRRSATSRSSRAAACPHLAIPSQTAERKEKAPATFVTGAFVLRPWQ